MKWWNVTEGLAGRENGWPNLEEYDAMAVQGPTERPTAGARHIRPQEFDDDGLTLHLGATQARVREIMAEFNIASATLGEMASQAEVAITDTALRAEYLRLLIDLHEFGGEAKARKLLSQTSDEPGSSGSASENGTRDVAKDASGEEVISNRASTNFFNSLDDVD